MNEMNPGTDDPDEEGATRDSDRSAAADDAPAVLPGLQPQPTQRIGAPPPQWQDQVGDPDPVWQAELDRERRRSRIFMGTTAVAGAALAASLFYGAAQGPNQVSETAAQLGVGGPGALPDGMMPDGGSRGMPGDTMGGPGGMHDGFVLQFFNEDGSVDTESVERFLAAGPTGTQREAMGQRLLAEIDEAVDSAIITQDQADELTDALELEDIGTSDTTGASDTKGT